jgi:hypothetical protein
MVTNGRIKRLTYYKPVKSNRPGKKFMVRVYLPKLNKDKIIHFGASAYGDYGSKTATKLQQMNYLRRAKGIRNKLGKRTMRDYKSPNYWSIVYIWKGKVGNVKLPLPKRHM